MQASRATGSGGRARVHSRGAPTMPVANGLSAAPKLGYT